MVTVSISGLVFWLKDLLPKPVQNRRVQVQIFLGGRQTFQMQNQWERLAVRGRWKCLFAPPYNQVILCYSLSFPRILWDSRTCVLSFTPCPALSCRQPFHSYQFLLQCLPPFLVLGYIYQNTFTKRGVVLGKARHPKWGNNRTMSEGSFVLAQPLQPPCHPHWQLWEAGRAWHIKTSAPQSVRLGWRVDSKLFLNPALTNIRKQHN